MRDLKKKILSCKIHPEHTWIGTVIIFFGFRFVFYGSGKNICFFGSDSVFKIKKIPILVYFFRFLNYGSEFDSGIGSGDIFHKLYLLFEELQASFHYRSQ